MTARNDPRLGITLMILTSLVFALQDGVSRHLASNYSVIMVVTLRFWFFAAFTAGGCRPGRRAASPGWRARPIRAPRSCAACCSSPRSA